MNTTSLLLIEEVRILRELFADLLNAQPDLHVVGQVSDPRAGVLRTRELDPDVAVVGVMDNEEERLRLVHELREAAPRTRLVVMNLRPTEHGVSQFLQAGVHGFILPETPVENTLHVIRIVANGMSEPAAVSAVAEPIGNGNGNHGSIDHLFGEVPAHLTKREIEIAKLISHGRSNKEIARELRLSLHTVKSHVRRIMEKLAFHSRVQIAAYAFGGLALAGAGNIPPKD
jgi:DNA-binding NarL/FixJ family response regulator